MITATPELTLAVLAKAETSTRKAIAQLQPATRSAKGRERLAILNHRVATAARNADNNEWIAAAEQLDRALCALEDIATESSNNRDARYAVFRATVDIARAHLLATQMEG